MQYLLLIYDQESQWAAMQESERALLPEGYRAFNQEVRASGELLGGDALRPTAMATSVRVREGKVLVTDGPFAETREQLGGYYLMETADLDRAIALAAKIPAAQSGTVEIRPIMVWNG